jgi:hypothetical protein
VSDLAPTFAWRYPTTDCKPLRQRVQVATDSSMRNVVIDQGLAANVVDWTPRDPLVNCTTYYWRVVPIGADGAPDPPSDVSSFRVVASRC